MKRYFLLLLSLTACELFGTPTPPPSVTLTASPTEGKAPLTVTFTAAASPISSTFNWTIGSELQSETGGTFETTFSAPGSYTVGVSANGASDNVTVTANAPTAPGTGMTLVQTPGGPAPWAVRYTVVADGGLDLPPPGLEARCEERLAYEPLRSDSFVCLHNVADTVQARVVGADGVIIAETETSPEVTANGGVAFAGGWRYRSRGVAETFEITEGTSTEGRSADGRFALFTVGERLGLIAEFTIDGRTVVLTPTPDDEGRQRYRGEVYGLELEPVLAVDPEPATSGTESASSSLRVGPGTAYR